MSFDIRLDRPGRQGVARRPVPFATDYDNSILTYAVSAYGFLMSPGQEYSYGELATLITEFYIDTSTAEVVRVLRKCNA